jgi:hypothetical protein
MYLVLFQWEQAPDDYLMERSSLVWTVRVLIVSAIAIIF